MGIPYKDGKTHGQTPSLGPKIAHVFFGAADGLILNRWSHDTLVLSLAI